MHRTVSDIKIKSGEPFQTGKALEKSAQGSGAAPSVEVFVVSVVVSLKRCILMVGLHNLKSLFQPK